MAVALGDQERLLGIRADILFPLGTGVIALVGKIVVGVDILQQMAFLQVANAGGRPAGVQVVGNPVGTGIKSVVVHTFVDPDAPEDNELLPVKWTVK